MRNRLIVFCLSLSAILLPVAGAQAASNLASQSSRLGGVSVQVTPRLVSGSTWEFEFSLNTHSGDLGEELDKAVVLVADGRTFKPAAWEGAPPGGHHRKGVLRFNPITPQPQAIELRLQRPGEPAPRLFHWQLR